LAEALPYCDAPDVFAAAIEGYPSEVVEDAIALQESQPRRRQLMMWYEVSQNTPERPPLTAYSPGEEVWAYFPQSKDKWMKATVEWVRGHTIRVVNGVLGMLVERDDLIAPGHWELAI
jgi:hypothetical protein